MLVLQDVYMMCGYVEWSLQTGMSLSEYEIYRPCIHVCSLCILQQGTLSFAIWDVSIDVVSMIMSFLNIW